VEAATYQGRPVFFHITGLWTRVEKPAQFSFALGGLTSRMVLLFLVLIPVAAGLLAWRNARMGRGDRRAAFRLATFAFFCVLVGGLADADHVPTLTEATVLYATFRNALVAGIAFWVLYMGFEPEVRRRLPAALVSWSRLLSGRFRDPALGGDLLIGLALGTAVACFAEGFFHPGSVLALAPQLPTNMAESFSLWTSVIFQAVGGALSYMFVLTLLMVLLRRQWLAAPVFVIGFTLVFTLGFSGSLLLVVLAREFLLIGLLWFALAKFGVVTAVAYAYVHDVSYVFPLTTHMSAWYASGAFFALATIALMAIYSFHATVAGRRLWPDSPSA
jgi:hypothetical protein